MSFGALRHAETAREYERLKQQIAARVVGQDAEAREEYARRKTDFIEHVVALALRNGYPKELTNTMSIEA